MTIEQYVQAGGFVGVYGARRARLAKSEEYTDRLFDALMEELRDVCDGDEKMLEEFDDDSDEF